MKQAGSLVAPDRLRFDFTHFEPMHHEQILEVERICNNIIMSDLPVYAYETSLTSAREAGVLALFGEKYGEFVRVIETGTFSKESAVVRTWATRAKSAYSRSSRRPRSREHAPPRGRDEHRGLRVHVADGGGAARDGAFPQGPPLDVSERVAKMPARLDELEGMRKRRMKAAAEGSVADFMERAIQLDGYKLIVADLGESVVQGMRDDVGHRQTAQRRSPFAVVLFARNPEGGNPLMLAAGNAGAVEAGFDAKDVIANVAPLIGGGGGGKPAMAQAGGKNADGIPAAIDKAKELFGI